MTNINEFSSSIKPFIYLDSKFIYLRFESQVFRRVVLDI